MADFVLFEFIDLPFRFYHNHVDIGNTHIHPFVMSRLGVAAIISKNKGLSGETVRSILRGEERGTSTRAKKIISKRERGKGKRS